MHGDERRAEDQQQNCDVHHAGSVQRRFEDARRVPEPGPIQLTWTRRPTTTAKINRHHTRRPLKLTALQTALPPRTNHNIIIIIIMIIIIIIITIIPIVFSITLYYATLYT